MSLPQKNKKAYLFPSPLGFVRWEPNFTAHSKQMKIMLPLNTTVHQCIALFTDRLLSLTEYHSQVSSLEQQRLIFQKDFLSTSSPVGTVNTNALYNVLDSFARYDNQATSAEKTAQCHIISTAQAGELVVFGHHLLVAANKKKVVHKKRCKQDFHHPDRHCLQVIYNSSCHSPWDESVLFKLALHRWQTYSLFYPMKCSPNNPQVWKPNYNNLQ